MYCIRHGFLSSVELRYQARHLPAENRQRDFTRVTDRLYLRLFSQQLSPYFYLEFLQNKQQREIANVIVEICLQQKVYNKFYLVLIKKLSEDNRYDL